MEAFMFCGMKHLAAFILAAFIAIGSAACSKPVFQYPATQFKLNPKTDKANKTIKVSGAAVRLEDDGWKLSLIFDNLNGSDVQDVSMANEPYPLALGEEGGKFAVAWEVPKERWKDKKPFIVWLGLNNSDNGNALIAVEHTTLDVEYTVLGYAVRVVLVMGCIVLLVVAPGAFIF
jgi:hypothetical protein